MSDSEWTFNYESSENCYHKVATLSFQGRSQFLIFYFWFETTVCVYIKTTLSIAKISYSVKWCLDKKSVYLSVLYVLDNPMEIIAKPFFNIYVYSLPS